MEDRIETKISKCFVNSTLTEFEQRTGNGMVGNLSRELEELKKERDIKILSAIKNIEDEYADRINSINKKILGKAKLMEK